MTDEPSADIPLFRLKQIDVLCDRFEQAWRTGQGPRIENYLEGFEGLACARLLRELIFLDLERRNSQSRRPQLTIRLSTSLL